MAKQSNIFLIGWPGFLVGMIICFCQLMIISSCAADVILQEGETKCFSPRPEVCTRQYEPVCGYLEGGKWQTFANACEACANKMVIKYHGGSCEKQHDY